MARTGANLLLLLAALFWGLGNVAQKTVLLDIGPFAALGGRGLIGLVVILPFVVGEARGAERRPLLRDFALPSIFFALALGMQQIAFGGTSVTNASFLVNTTVLFTPLFAWLMLRERPAPMIWPAIVLALMGVLLMAGSLTDVAWGDAACLVSAMLYSVWIVLVAAVMRRVDRPFALAACQFAAAMLLGVAVSSLAERTTMEALTAALPELAVLGVFSTGAAFALQAVAQRHTPPSDSAIIMSAESVFGALAAALLLDETATSAGLLGAAGILLAIVLVQLPANAVALAVRSVVR